MHTGSVSILYLEKSACDPEMSRQARKSFTTSMGPAITLVSICQVVEVLGKVELSAAPESTCYLSNFSWFQLRLNTRRWPTLASGRNFAYLTMVLHFLICMIGHTAGIDHIYVCTLLEWHQACILLLPFVWTGGRFRKVELTPPVYRMKPCATYGTAKLRNHGRVPNWPKS